MAQTTPRIRELPQDGRFWRVDWLGAVLPNPSISTEPGFQVVLSPFKKNPMDASGKDLAAIGATDRNQQQTIHLGIGQLPYIEIGSIWLDGHKQNKLAGNLENLPKLFIDSSTTQVVPALHKHNDFSLIPYSSYRIGKPGAGSHLVSVSLGEDPYRILIPAMELIRFYYAVSTHLAHALFTGILEHNPDAIINSERTYYQPEDDRVVLGLRQHMIDEEGWVIARLLHSPIATKARKTLYDETLRDTINRRFVHPTASFPFEGKTNLVARVKWLRDHGSSAWHCLVLGLEECSAPMPYSELTVIRDNDGNPANDSTDIPDFDKQDYSRPKPKINEDESLDLQNQHDTNAGIQPTELTLPTSRFKAIRGRKPDKPTKEQCRFRSVGGRAMASMVVDKLGTGQGGYGEEEQTTQRLNIVPEHQEQKKTPLPSRFETFVEAVELLNQTEGFTAEIRTAESLEYMPLIKPPGKWQWSYLDSSRRLRRKVIVADISFNGYCFSLIEFEHRVNRPCRACLVHSGEKFLIDQDIYSLLLSNALQGGVWDVKGFEAGHLIPLKHTWTDHAAFAASVSHRILAVGDNKVFC